MHTHAYALRMTSVRLSAAISFSARDEGPGPARVTARRLGYGRRLVPEAYWWRARARAHGERQSAREPVADGGQSLTRECLGGCVLDFCRPVFFSISLCLDLFEVSGIGDVGIEKLL